MKKPNSYLISILLVFTLLFFLLSSCHPRHDEPEPYGYWNVPDGGTAVIANTDLSGQGLLTNRALTTWIISGDVVMDDLSIIGYVIIDSNAHVLVRGLVNVAGGGELSVHGQLNCTTLTQVGNAYYSSATVQVSGQYTLAGGTSTYLQNSLIKVNDLRMEGAIYALENNFTKATNVFSVFYFNGNNPYLNRAGGTTVCGPVLFTYNNDQGTSGVALDDYTSNAMSAQPKLRSIYHLPSTSSFYRYADQNCTPVSSPPPGF